MPKFFAKVLFSTRGLPVAGILAMICAVSFCARFDLQAGPAIFAAAPATNGPIESPAGPIPAETKTRMGFLAAAGLVVLSLLILATGLALLRAFKQH